MNLSIHYRALIRSSRVIYKTVSLPKLCQWLSRHPLYVWPTAELKLSDKNTYYQTFISIKTSVVLKCPWLKNSTSVWAHSYRASSLEIFKKCLGSLTDLPKIKVMHVKFIGFKVYSGFQNYFNNRKINIRKKLSGNLKNIVNYWKLLC